jgi:hypothetical protein
MKRKMVIQEREHKATPIKSNLNEKKVLQKAKGKSKVDELVPSSFDSSSSLDSCSESGPNGPSDEVGGEDVVLLKKIYKKIKHKPLEVIYSIKKYLAH